MEKLVFFIIAWVAAIAAYMWLVRWVQGRFNISVSGSQNWGAVHILIMALFVFPAVAILGAVWLVTTIIDKNKGGSGDDLQI